MWLPRMLRRRRSGARLLARTPALLWGVLSLTAGSADVISFLGLGGLFNSHITGNLMILAVRVVSDDTASPCLLLPVPVFVVVVFLARVLAARLQFAGVPPLLPLLVLQLALLTVASPCLSAADRWLWQE
jgi:uncharacterized membrane protein YoaK (UPF0700 family)